RTRLDITDQGFAHRHGQQRMRVAVDLQARQLYSVELTFERVGTRLRRLDWHPRTSCRGISRRLANRDTEVGEHAAYIACFGVDPLFELAERGGLFALDLVERQRDACEHAGGLLVRRRYDRFIDGRWQRLFVRHWWYDRCGVHRF